MTKDEENLFIIQVRDEQPCMSGKSRWVNTTLPMSGHDAAQAVAFYTRTRTANGNQMEDYRIVLAEGCSFDCDVCSE